MSFPVTQRTLARIAKVSHTTVSLALRSHPSIPLATRKRILDLARRKNYRPDPALAALNSYRLNQTAARFRGCLAWLTSGPTASAWRDMIQVDGYFFGATKQAERLGYQLTEFWIADPTLTSERATQILLARGVRGLIVAPTPKAHGEIKLDWPCFSAVTLGYSLERPQLHMVMNHQFRNMRHVVSNLAALGYQKIGLAMPAAKDERVDHNYLGGFWIAQREVGSAAARAPTLLAKTFDRPKFWSWFKRNRPDAVIVSAEQANDVIAWLEAEGLSVPGDVGIAVASIPYGNATISGINENVPMIGAMAVDTVIGMLHRHEQGIPAFPCRILTEGVWFPGTTVRKVGKPQRAQSEHSKTL